MAGIPGMSDGDGETHGEETQAGGGIATTMHILTVSMMAFTITGLLATTFTETAGR